MRAGTRVECTVPWDATYVASDGTVFPCCIMGLRMGSLLTESWEDIWNGPMYRHLRRSIHGWNPPFGCRRCPLHNGILRGDQNLLVRHFASFEAKPVALDSPTLALGAGFHELERRDEAPSHVWMAKRGSLSVQMTARAKFLRLHIVPATAGEQAIPSVCRINGGREEPFDTSCEDAHFPLDHVKDGTIGVEISMDCARQGGPDPRELALGIRGIELLCDP
jgi:hypothetical protein